MTKQQAQELKKSSKELEKLNSLALNLQLLTQKTIIDSPLNLGFKIKKMVKTPDIYSMDRQRHQQAYERFAEVNPVIEFMYIADSKGILFSYSLGKKDGEIPDILKIGNDDSKRPWFVNAANSKLPYISKVYKSFFSNEDCFSVAIEVNTGKVNNFNIFISFD